MKPILCLIAATLSICNYAFARLRLFLARIQCYLAPRLYMPFKPLWLLTMVVALSFHPSIYGSSLQPKGNVAGTGSTAVGPFCSVKVASYGEMVGLTSVGGPGMCLFVPEQEFPDVRVGDIAVFCAPDATASPCSGRAVALVSGVGFSIPTGSTQQFRIDVAAIMNGVVAGGTTSAILNVCSDIACLTPLPIQPLSDGVISVSQIVTLPILFSVVIEVDVDSMPAGATLSINNFVLNFTPDISTMGVIQVCKKGEIGIASGTPFNFNLQQFTRSAPPVSQVITVSAGLNTESCSDNLLFPKGSFAVIHEIASTNETVADITGTADPNSSAVDILRGTAGVIVGDSPIKFTFFNKTLGAEGCGAGYYRNHIDSFPSLFSTTENVGFFFNFLYPPGTTFLQVLGANGGPGLQDAINLLSRSAVTALLNAAHPEVAYALTMADVFQLAIGAFASNDRATMLAVSDKLDSLNNGAGGCPLQ